MRRDLDERGLPEGYPLQEGVEISPREASERLGSGEDDFVLLDIREAGEVAQARVEGAVHVPLSELGARLSELDIEEDTPIGVLCHRGVRSMSVAALLREQGFSGARSVAGGIDLWSLAVDQGVPRY
ncbi:MAG: rhodanese-like domain-containing protein [Phycisphaerales bacterium]